MKKELKLNKKTLLKCVLTAILIVLMLFTISTVNAEELKGIKTGGSGEQVEKAKNLMNTLAGYAQFIGITISVIMLIMLGVEYFTKSDNPKGTAEAHNKMQSILIGFVLIVGATIILTFIKDTSLKLDSELNAKAPWRQINYEQIS